MVGYAPGRQSTRPAPPWCAHAARAPAIVKSQQACQVREASGPESRAASTCAAAPHRAWATIHAGQTPAEATGSRHTTAASRAHSRRAPRPGTRVPRGGAGSPAAASTSRWASGWAAPAGKQPGACAGWAARRLARQASGTAAAPWHRRVGSSSISSSCHQDPPNLARSWPAAHPPTTRDSSRPAPFPPAPPHTGPCC